MFFIAWIVSSGWNGVSWDENNNIKKVYFFLKFYQFIVCAPLLPYTVAFD